MDYERYLMLLLSILLTILTAGFGVWVAYGYVLLIARHNIPVNIKYDILLVLGKRLINNRPDEEYTSRLNRVVTTIKLCQLQSVYILGGKTANSNISESSAGRDFLLNLGVQDVDVYVEENSTHTLENLKNYSLLQEKKQSTLLVTNRYHMARSMVMAKGFNITVVACPAELEFHYTATNLGKILTEAFYLNFYWVGRYFATITNNKKMLDRLCSP